MMVKHQVSSLKHMSQKMLYPFRVTELHVARDVSAGG